MLCWLFATIQEEHAVNRTHKTRVDTAVLAFAGLTLACLPLTAQHGTPRPMQTSRSALQVSAALPQPTPETVDLNMYQRIMDEGFNHSHVMEYASALADDIGPRLTGSPSMEKANQWTRNQFAAMGCANAHLESWGKFGLGWEQLNTWVRMVTPDPAVFIAQATPWSPSTNGPVTGDSIQVNIQNENDFDRYKGKLAGKIVLFGEMRPVPPADKSLFWRYTDDDLEKIAQYSTGSKPFENRGHAYLQRLEFMNRVGHFFTDEHVAGVVLPSRDGQRGGSGGTFFDDSYGQVPGPIGFGHQGSLPVVVMAIENYGRICRLLQANVPVSLQMDVETKFTGEQKGYDTIAEISGTDPALKDQVVMLGGHLDSWTAGTGATDDGAGTIITMEVMRILTALHVQPRRTIRAALWSGEEEGLLGSWGYVTKHFGGFPLSTDPDQLKLLLALRKPAGPLTTTNEQKLVSAYFNLDDGSGRIRGVYLHGNAATAPIFQQWIAPLKDLGVTTLAPGDIGGGTDHLSFEAVGIPSFDFIQDPLDFESRRHHSNMDVYEGLVPADLKQAAVVEAIFVYNAAMDSQELPRGPLPKPEPLLKGGVSEPQPLSNVFLDTLQSTKPQ
jgi:carboxypeptidase Q